MKKLFFSSLRILSLTPLFFSLVPANDIDPIVSTEWLAANLKNHQISKTKGVFK